MRREATHEGNHHLGSWLRPSSRRLIVLGVVVLVFGLLLWAKLLLVTGHPRTAIADPDGEAREEPAGQQDPDQSAPLAAPGHRDPQSE